MCFLTRSLLCILMLVHAALVQAEMYIVTDQSDDIIIGDHLQSGIGFQESRRIGGQWLDDPLRVQVYTQDFGDIPAVSWVVACTGSFGGGATAWTRIENEEPARVITRGLNSNATCSEFVLHRGNRFLLGESKDYVEVHPVNCLPGAPSQCSTNSVQILEEPFNWTLLSLKADGDFLYALTAYPDVVRWDLRETTNTVSSRSVASYLNQQFDEKCPRPWTAFEVHQGLLYVATGPSPGKVFCVIDIDSGSLLRTLSHPEIQNPRDLTISGEELFIVDESGIYTFDIGAGGVVPAKRVISMGGVRNIWVTQQPRAVHQVLKVALEEPVNGAVHTGVGNLRGWAVSTEDITKVDVFVDGVLFQSAPYGGKRADVFEAFRSTLGSRGLFSGFSLAFNYSGLPAGEHTIMVRAETTEGWQMEASSTFTSIRPGQEFIVGDDAVDLSSASCSIDSDRIRIEDIAIDGDGPWDALLQWRRATQGFEAEKYIFNADGI